MTSTVMQLANEDKLRLNVLLAQPLRAVRINESTMEVQALTVQGEARVALNPTVNTDIYLRWVRELLAIKATGSAAVYPVFIKRWTRSGQLSHNIEKLLLLGEPEAIIAVSYAPKITPAIARCAWWANPCTEVAMGLLQHTAVVTTDLGQELANHLLEFMPFEELAVNRVHMVRLCLQRDLLTPGQCDQLWLKARRQNPYLVGFAYAESEMIPVDAEQNPAYQPITHALSNELATDNIWAQTLCYLLGTAGQCWLTVIKNCLQKPADPDVVVALFTAIDLRFAVPKPKRGMELLSAEQKAQNWLFSEDDNTSINKVKTALPQEHLPLLQAMLVLGQLGENSLNPIFSSSDAFGSVMRKRLQPLITPIETNIDILLG